MRTLVSQKSVGVQTYPRSTIACILSTVLFLSIIQHAGYRQEYHPDNVFPSSPATLSSRITQPHWNVQVFVSSSSGLSLEGFVAAMLPPSSEAPAGGTPLEPLRRRRSSSLRTSSSGGGGARVNQPSTTSRRSSKKRSSVSGDHHSVVADRTGNHSSSSRRKGGGGGGRRNSKNKKRRKQSARLLDVPRVPRSDASRDTTRTRTRTTAGQKQGDATLFVGNERHPSRGSTGKLRRGRRGSSRGSSGGEDGQALTGRVGRAASFQSEMEKVGVVTDLVELFQQVGTVHNAVLSV